MTNDEINNMKYIVCCPLCDNDKCVKDTDKCEAEIWAKHMEMNEQMDFPETFEEFAKEYGFKDDKEVYTNGIDLIPIFRVKQWLEHDNKFRTIEIDAAYECGKHANKWIPCSERLPEKNGNYLVTVESNDGTASIKFQTIDHWGPDWLHDEKKRKVIAWMPLPEPYQSND